jgi:hypothetical protein
MLIKWIYDKILNYRKVTKLGIYVLLKHLN